MHGDDEVLLKGGRANTGSVWRIGDQVARPSYPQSAAVNHFLEHLQRRGIHGTPTPLGQDDQGRERLTFVPGQAPMPPYPAWAFDESLLRQVARFQRQLHQAAQDYQPPQRARWAESAGDYFPIEARQGQGLVVCHNDLGMTNVTVDENHDLVGVIDFDYCCPVDPLFDIAVAARHWVPFGDLDVDAGIDLDRVRRFRFFCDVHELTRAQRNTVVDYAAAFLEQARRNIKSLAEQGGIGFQQLLAAGYEETNKATVRWIADHRNALAELTSLA